MIGNAVGVYKDTEQKNSMRKTALVVLFSCASIFLSGCSALSTGALIPESQKTMLDIYHADEGRIEGLESENFNGLFSKGLVDDGTSIQSVKNPPIEIYVKEHFEHGHPVPAYATQIPLYEKHHYTFSSI